MELGTIWIKKEGMKRVRGDGINRWTNRSRAEKTNKEKETEDNGKKSEVM